MARKLPRFEPVGIREGRTFWRKYRGNADVERMLLEIAQAREVMQQIGDYFDCLHKVWVEENLGQLVAPRKDSLAAERAGPATACTRGTQTTAS
ncbi:MULTISPECIES: hypothetical protein [unclassified Caballeronia]|uniref:hypothetical protein n=1 Tax=unclassified Caballeronia TaxID=2646786 RepID=UPI002866E5F5|nr:MULTISPECIES: hypothetical protein [unclassified Caballeronia]MDR5776428.1 hypothetical protein [Caballeronia sp. LZ002]MDR5851790.1 hypothetical protein [Caballeronia sp. LZ003]